MKILTGFAGCTWSSSLYLHVYGYFIKYNSSYKSNSAFCRDRSTGLRLLSVHWGFDALIIYLCFVPHRTPALQLGTTSGTLPADCSGRIWRPVTSSGTLRSSWWAQMGSLWWGGTQESTFLRFEPTYGDTCANATPRGVSLRSDPSQQNPPSDVETCSDMCWHSKGRM